MANTLLSSTIILKEALRQLVNNLVFVRNINREYSKEFANEGAKVGTTINVRKPVRYYVSKQTALKIQDTTETTIPVSLTTPYQVAMSFSDSERTLVIEDFSKRYIQPAMAQLASQIDYDGLNLAMRRVYNCVGTAGVTPGTTGYSGTDASFNYTAPAVFLNAGAKLSNMACPPDRRGIVLSPIAMANSVAGLSGLTNDAGTIGKQYLKGRMAHALNFDFAEDQNVNTLTTGTRAGTIGASSNATITTTATTGDNHLHITWASDTVTGLTIKEGEIVNVGGVYSVNPENQQSTGFLQDFVVTADTTIVNNTTEFELPVSPSVTLAGTGIADGTVNALPTSAAKIYFRTSKSATTAVASEAIPCNLAYHPDFMTFATADLEMPKGADFAARETYEGISMRIWRDADINSATFPCRIDVLGGWNMLDARLACKILG